MAQSAASDITCPDCQTKNSKESAYCMSCASPLLFGKEVGTYLVSQRIGQGGVGEVYLATDQETQQQIALKILRPEYKNRKLMVQRFMHEARISLELKHPYLVETYQVGQSEQYGPYISMELLKGQTMEEALEEHGKLSPTIAIEWFCQICEGLHYAHQQNIVHRDLKPANVFLVDHEQKQSVKVVDFGLAKALTTVNAGLTQQGTFVGTPQYMAPEQVTGQVTLQTDIYALGLIMFELLSGKKPYRGTTFLELMSERMMSQAPLLSSLSQEFVHPGLDDLIARCLRSTASERPANMLHVKEELEQVAFELLSKSTTYASDEFKAVQEAPTKELPEDAPPPSQPPQTNLHHPVTTFSGRQKQLEELEDKLLKEEQAVISIVGPEGIGKTALAHQLAWRHKEHFTGGIWYCPLHYAKSENDILRLLAEVLDTPMDHQDPGTQLLRNLQGRGKVLLFFDNGATTPGELAPLLQKWLQQMPELSALLTSRTTLRLPDQHLYKLSPLSPEEGQELMQKLLQHKQPNLDFTEELLGELRTFAELADGNPLAIEVGAVECLPPITTFQVKDLVERYRSRQKQASQLKQNPFIWAALECSWEALNKEERQVLAQCSIFYGSFTPEAADAVLVLESPNSDIPISQILGNLIEKGVLTSEEGKAGELRLFVGESIRFYAAEKLRTWEALHQMSSHASTGFLYNTAYRHASYYASFGYEEVLRYILRFEGLATFRHLQTDLENVFQACHWAIRHGFGSQAIYACRAIWTVLYKTGPQHKAYELIKEILEIPQLTVIEQSFAHVVALDIAQAMGKLEEAQEHSEQAEKLFIQEKNPFIWGQWLHLRGHLLLRTSKLKEATAAYKHSIRNHRAQNDLHSECLSLLGYAVNLQRLNLLDEAIQRNEEALKIAQYLGTRKSEGLAQANLGRIYTMLGKWEEAKGYYHPAIEIMRERGERLIEGFVLCSLGELHVQMGEWEEALKHLQHSLEVRESIGSKAPIGYSYEALGEYHRLKGEYQEAIDFFDKGLEIFQEIKEPMMICILTGYKGVSHLGQGEGKKARELLSEAIIVSEDAHPLCAGVFRGYLALAWTEAEQWENAKQVMQEALQRIPQDKQPAAWGILRCQEAQVYYLSGDENQAQHTLAAAKELLKAPEQRPSEEWLKVYRETEKLIRKKA